MGAQGASASGRRGGITAALLHVLALIAVTYFGVGLLAGVVLAVLALLYPAPPAEATDAP